MTGFIVTQGILATVITLYKNGTARHNKKGR